MTTDAPLWPDLTPRFEPWIGRVRGQLIPNQLLGEMTTLRVGGPAQLFFRPADEDDLSYFLRNLPEDIRLTVIGLGSNLLIRDGGLDGVVIRLPAKTFGGIEILDGYRVRVGTAVPDVKVATAAAEAGIDGLWFYRGIPGGIGGALYMNAGCYKTETMDRMVELRAVLRNGDIVTLTHADMGYRYRKSNGPRGAIFTSAVYQGFPGDPETILTEMRTVTERRERSQPPVWPVRISTSSSSAPAATVTRCPTWRPEFRHASARRPPPQWMSTRHARAFSTHCPAPPR